MKRSGFVIASAVAALACGCGSSHAARGGAGTGDDAGADDAAADSSGSSNGWGALSSDTDWMAGAADDTYGVVLGGMRQGNVGSRVEERDGDSGAVVLDFDPDEPIAAQALALDANDVYLAGEDIKLDTMLSVAAYSRSSGATLWVQTTTGFSQCGNSYGAMTVDAAALYVAGAVNVSGGCDPNGGYYDIRQHVEARSLDAGKVLWQQTFGGGAYTIYEATQVVADSSSLYLAGRSGFTNTPFVLQKLNKSDGTQVWSVNAAGNASGGFVLDGADIYVHAGGTSTSNKGSSLQRRRAVDGSLVWEVTSPDTTPTGIVLLKGNVFVFSAGQPMRQISKTDGAVAATSSFSLPPDQAFYFADMSDLFSMTTAAGNGAPPQVLSKFTP